MPATVVSSIEVLKPSPLSCSVAMTNPATAEITAMSSMVRPVSSKALITCFSDGRVSFWNSPTTSVAIAAAMPALPASHEAIMSVYTRIASGTMNTQPRRMMEPKRGSSERGSPFN